MPRRRVQPRQSGTFTRNGSAITNNAWKVVWLPEALKEYDDLVKDKNERVAIQRATEKLEVIGTRLGFPHQSAVKGTAASIREVRPRGGGSPWRCLYAQVERDTLVVLAVTPDGAKSRRQFKQALGRAENRLKKIKP